MCLRVSEHHHQVKLVLGVGLTSCSCVPLKITNGTAVIASAEISMPCHRLEERTCVGTGLRPLIVGATVIPAVVAEPMSMLTIADLCLDLEAVVAVCSTD